MIAEEPKPIPENLQMPCYACENEPATHLCKFKVGELSVQVCLCPACMKLDTHYLLRNTIGIQEVDQADTDRFLSRNHPVALAL